LIVPFRAVDATTPAERNGLLDEAADWLEDAAKLDAVERPGQTPYSYSNFIPQMRFAQLRIIDKIRNAPEVAQNPRQ